VRLTENPLSTLMDLVMKKKKKIKSALNRKSVKRLDGLGDEKKKKKSKVRLTENPLSAYIYNNRIQTYIRNHDVDAVYF
jgi:hypothetical protein